MSALQWGWAFIAKQSVTFSCKQVEIACVSIIALGIGKPCLCKNYKAKTQGDFKVFNNLFLPSFIAVYYNLRKCQSKFYYRAKR